jgi:hypothetical protein
MRGSGALLGFLGIIAAIPVFGVLKLLGIKHDFDLMDMAGFIIIVVPVVSVWVLLICRFLGLWPLFELKRLSQHLVFPASSAQVRRMGGIVRRSALAVSRLMISSNFVGCSTGRSAGLAPFKILST